MSKSQRTKGANPTESDEQRALCQWLDLCRICYFAVPNGGNRSRVTGAILKGEGVKAGVPDIVIIDPPPAGPEVPGVVLELKRRKGGHLSGPQLIWLEKFRKRGWPALVAKGFKDAKAQLEALGYGVKR